MKKTAVFPGSFDPFTVGHFDIVERALPMFDEIIIAIGHNSAKKYHLSLQNRVEILEKLFEDEPKINSTYYEGLTAKFCQKRGAQFIIRGLRSSSDFEYEKTIAQLNRAQNAELETIFLISSPRFSHISSTIVREIWKHGGDISQFIPSKIRGLL